ncbi:MAG: bifunctional (p)ppGpp synthetase/guanosine-3',5'-bis(diphosphate) 3'-pyrophosphohydrolase [Sulfuriferula sp.]
MMVTTNNTTQDENADAAIARLVAGMAAADANMVRQVAAWSRDQPDAPFIAEYSRWQHALGTALQVVDLHLDAHSVAAALLLGLTLDEHAPVPVEVVKLAQGVTKMDSVAQLITGRGEGHNQVENLRQMLLAMVEDVRVVLIKLAERAHALRLVTPSADDVARWQVAQEVRELFAPLANRLGVWQIKWEMEDLSYRILEPEHYKQIATLLDEKRLDRERYIEDVLAILRTELAAVGIKAEVTGRPKHIVSIINKMKRKHLAFEQLYDIRAVRILVPELKDCYTALGIVHHLWQPISGEFDDYIAHPKSNDYRSLHTGMIGPENKALEVQIRTFDMHNHAELGVAAHWRYKEGATRPTGAEDKIAWLRQILQWKDDLADGQALADLFKNELFQDRIYVLTPQGRVVDLAAGASPVDFAYHLHTDLGHRCRGAKVDGAIVPLNTALKNGQRVEILTAKQGTPSRDWLNPSLGYLVTPRARAKVRHWFRYQYFTENIAQGRDILDRELRRLGAADINIDKIAQKLNEPKGDEFFAAIGRGDVSVKQLSDAIAALRAPVPATAVVRRGLPGPTKHKADAILIGGMGDLPVTLARCCQPAPPAAIVGYATQGRGVTVHRADCSNVLRVQDERKDRLLAASWAGEMEQFSSDIAIAAYDRHGLLRDISEIFTKEGIAVTRVNTETQAEMATMAFRVMVSQPQQIKRALHKILTLSNVVSAVEKG